MLLSILGLIMCLAVRDQELPQLMDETSPRYAADKKALEMIGTIPSQYFFACIFTSISYLLFCVVVQLGLNEADENQLNIKKYVFIVGWIATIIAEVLLHYWVGFFYSYLMATVFTIVGFLTFVWFIGKHQKNLKSKRSVRGALVSL